MRLIRLSFGALAVALVLALGAANTTSAKGPKPKPVVKAKGKGFAKPIGTKPKPAVVPPKARGKAVGKARRDLRPIPAVKAKGKAVGRGKVEPPPPAVAPPAADKLGRAIGKDKSVLEMRKHLRRLAKIDRLEQVAQEGNNEKLLGKVQLLRDKEVKRYQRVLARVDKKPASEEAAAVKE
ncbi:hypothetical protein ACFL6C_04815 [Myxococcota bacterium]